MAEEITTRWKISFSVSQCGKSLFLSGFTHLTTVDNWLGGISWHIKNRLRKENCCFKGSLSLLTHAGLPLWVFLLKNSSFPHFFLLCIISGNYFSCISGLYSCSVCSLAVPLMSTEVARYRFVSFARNNLVIGNSRLQSVCNVYEIMPKALLWEKSLLTSLYMCINREWRLDRRWSVRRRHCTWACTETCGWLRNRDTR